MPRPCLTLANGSSFTSALPPCAPHLLHPLIPGRNAERLFPIIGTPEPLNIARNHPPITTGVLVFNPSSAIKGLQPDYTLSMPIHNREHTLLPTLERVFATTTGIWELVIVLDACTDKTEAVLWEWLAAFTTHQYPRMRARSCACALAARALSSAVSVASFTLPMRIVVMATEASRPLYETASDNWAMSTSNPSSFYALIQADTLLHEHGWNTKMAALAYAHREVFAIGGRCGGDSTPNGNASGARALKGDCNGQWFRPPPAALVGESGLTLHLRDWIVRAPLLLRASYTRELGFLDELRFFHGRDDHNLCLRAAAAGYVCGYLPIDVLDGRRFAQRLDGETDTIRDPKVGTQLPSLPRLIPSGRTHISPCSPHPTPSMIAHEIPAGVRRGVPPLHEPAREPTCRLPQESSKYEWDRLIRLIRLMDRLGDGLLLLSGRSTSAEGTCLPETS